MQDSEERSFQAYGRPLKTATLFKYMGQVLTAVDDEWPAVMENLWKAWNSWVRLERILGWEGYSPWVSGVSFKAVLQAVSFIWV